MTPEPGACQWRPEGTTLALQPICGEEAWWLGLDSTGEAHYCCDLHKDAYFVPVNTKEGTR